jgi:phosphate butyryltransferase
MIARLEDLLESVRNAAASPRVVVAGADDHNVLGSLHQAVKQKIIEATLIGEKDAIVRIARELSVDLGDFEIIDRTNTEECVEEAVTRLKEGRASILMKGRLSTGDLMRAVVRKASALRTGRILSHVAVFTAPQGNRLLLLTDAGINIAPSLDRKVDIILNAVDVAKVLGIETPKVALLAFVEKVRYPSTRSAPERATTDAAMLTELNLQGAITGCIVEGPYGLDNAVSPEAARLKKIEGKVAGRADILVAHDINMGNVIYKTLQVWKNMVFASVVVGSQSPIIVPSRADSEETKLYSIALAVYLLHKNPIRR